jgi:uncharacterized protein YecE (DUF72 family)
MFTELNFSYYRQPDARTLARMVHATPEGFLFAVKGHRTLTHETGGDLAAEARVFKEGIRPLVEAGRLACVLMQLPYRYHYTSAARTYLDRLCSEFEQLPTAVEFRNSEWQRESVYRGLAARGVAYVNVDEPLLPGLPRPTALVTAPHAYVRFHGRNAANWWTGDNTSRYDYGYTGDELAEWVPRIKELTTKSTNVMVLFNNHFQGKAVDDARKLKELLEEVGLEVR